MESYLHNNMTILHTPKLIQNCVFKCLITAFILSLGFSINVTASTVYTYEDADGNIHITNKKPRGNNHTLIRKMHFRPYRDRAPNERTPFFEKGIASEYDNLIKALSAQHQMDPALIKAVVHIESAFQNDAVSHAGAMGLMQLMPRTAAIYDLTSNHFEPRANLTAGIKHLKYLLKRYKGDKRISLAAYNAGETAVARHNGIPPFKETQRYVKKVLSLYSQYKKSYLG